jgi:hypothetical protein
LGFISAWIAPPNSRFFPEYHASTSSPFLEAFVSTLQRLLKIGCLLRERIEHLVAIAVRGGA